MMKWLEDLVRGLHWSIGISEPPPGQERFYVYVWIGILIFLAGVFAALLYVFG